MADIGYELDLLGNNPKNKVTERRTLTSKVSDGRTIMIPKAAPFHKFATPATATSTVVVMSGGKQLVPDVDYDLILISHELTDLASVEVYGGILFHKLKVNTVVDVTVQTIGGDFNLPVNNTVESMAQTITNPKFASWSDVTPTPNGLPPYQHNQDFSTAAGYDEYMVSFDRLIRAVLALGGNGGGDANAVLEALNAHIASTAAHKKEAVGLGNVDNFKTATNADFDAKPAANNKFVTPRLVHYAFLLWVGEDIKSINDSLEKIDERFKKIDTDWSELQKSLNEINNNLDSINSNYTAMVLQVQSYEDEVAQLKTNYDVIIENQRVWAETIERYAKELDGYRDDYKKIIEIKDELIAEFNKLKDSYDVVLEAIKEQALAVKTLREDVDYLMLNTVHPERFAITSGVRRFRIKQRERWQITLVGAGGGVGIYSPDAPNVGAVMLGQAGGDTVFRIDTNLVNGEMAPQLKPIALAEGGGGGNSTYGDAAGKVAVHGIGGRGGTFEHDLPLIELHEASVGEGGFKGVGDFDIKKQSKQDTGYEYYGGKWGKGAITAEAIGQGGEGAQVIFVYENKTQFVLDAVIEVGTRGKSFNHLDNNATNGIAIVARIKK